MYRRVSKAKKLLSRNEMLSRLPFVVAVVGGGIILSIMKLYDINQLIVSLVAIGFIVIYALSVTMIPVLRLREDQLGDNCYYLGFLYTLGSLVWALESFSRTKSVDEIIANFGLALFSTIIGIMLRVVINQSRKDIMETERECRIELASAVARMRSTIDEATTSLDSFCRVIQQQTSETIVDAVEKTTHAIASCTNSMQALNDRITVGITASLQNYQERAGGISEAIKSIEREMLCISDRLKYVEVDKQLITTKLQPVVAHIETSIGELTSAVKEHNNSLVQEIKKTKTITAELATTLTEVAHYISENVK